MNPWRARLLAAAPRRRSLAILVAALLPCGVALANNDTFEDDLLGDLAKPLAPLALSADGRTRVHVDDHRVLHRVSLADPAHDQAFQLPAPVRAVAASRTAQKVALRTDAGCVGLVDFGADDAHPVLRWWRASFPGERHPAPAGWPAWVDEAPAACAPPDGVAVSMSWPALALSPDGRLLATDRDVVDTQTDRLLASLRAPAIRVRFVAGGRRLLAQSLVSSDRDESYNAGLSESIVGVWDLPAGSLSGLRRRRVPELSANVLALDVPAGGRVAWWVDEAWPAGAPPGGASRLTLHRWDLGGCGPAADVAVASLPAGHVRQLVVDPLGRWVATASDAADPAQAGVLRVQSLADGRVLLRRPLADARDGLLATPDGTRLIGLEGGKVNEMPIDVHDLRPAAAGASAPAASAAPDAAEGCVVDGASAASRELARTVHPLVRAWERRWPLSDGGAAEATPSLCPDSASGSGPAFLRADGSFWDDRGALIALVNPDTGADVRVASTPRRPSVCSVTGPGLPAWFNVQGDTLTLRAFDDAANARRVLEQRPGWTASELMALPRAVRVVWRARPGTVKPSPSGESPRDLVVAVYDAAGRRLGQHVQDADGYDFAGDAAQDLWASDVMPPCVDAAGPIVGPDWRLDVFNGFRADDCGPAGAPRVTRLWADIDIRARPGAVFDAAATRVAWGRDGDLAVAQQDDALRVFDVAQRRELGQVALRGAVLKSVAVSASRRLLLVKTLVSSDGQPPSIVLQAWRIP